MDMLNILKNFDAAGQGKKPSAGGAAKNEMKAILESLQECGMGMPTAPMEKPGNPVTMNISLNASGKDNVDELMAILKGAGLDSKPQPIGQERDMAAMKAALGDIENSRDGALDIDMDSDHQHDLDTEEVEEGDYANSPDEDYKDDDYMIKDLAGGINRPKKSFAKAQDGDNAMAVESVKDRLWAALNEKKEDYSAKKARAGKDIGKPGKNFAKIAKKSGGGEKGEKIAGAVLAKLRKG